MKQFTTLVCILSAVVLNLLPGCDGLDEQYSTNPNHRLAFSKDTLSFDTIFSSVGSTTRQFMIYNHQTEALNMESILLAGGGTTGFRMNVDGRKGTAFSNVGILGKDSMYVFVEVTVDPNGTNQPLLIQDSVVFVTNGIRQSVKLEAYGQDVNLYKGGAILTKDTILTANRPYLIYDSLIIAPGAKVTIEQGATFYMHDNAQIVSYGTINAAGTLDQPVLFRGDRLDFILENVLPYDRTPAQWGGLFFKDESFDNTLEHVIVRNATTGITCERSHPQRSKLTINNAQITNSGTDLLSAINCQITATNSEFSNAKGSVVTLVGGSYYFAHCTLANYMTLMSRQGGASRTLRLLHNATAGENGPYPLLRAHFDNCLLDGSFSAGEKELTGELQISSGGTFRADDTEDFDFRFNHCLIKTKSMTDPRFNNVIFATKSPAYRLTGEKEKKYAFDFRLATEKEQGVGKADASVAGTYPKDRYGIDRLSATHGPTIGAYEYVASKTD